VIHHGDCLDVMAAMEPESVDAIVTDPPYNIGFMGKAWDSGHGHGPWAEAAYRVAKPSAYLLAFGGTRTVHRMTVALEDAGWIIRDMLVWLYLSGFPKSRASLKPSWEPIILARKPGPLRMLDIEGCRIPFASDDDLALTQLKNPGKDGALVTSDVYGADRPQQLVNPLGRWPANVLTVDPAVFDGWPGMIGTGPETSRVFCIPKADRADREPVLGGLPEREGAGPVEGHRGRRMAGEVNMRPDGRISRSCANVHPTVKPTDLMRHLVRLVTPTGGTVLDPFLGSGSTALAAEMEGFPWIGIEREAEYVAIAEARLNGTQRGLGLEASWARHLKERA
jgi:hypothetical protein